MATIRKRGQKYQAIVRRKGFGSTSKTFHKKADAQQWARHLETKADRGDLPPNAEQLSKIILKDILVRYRDEISVNKKSYDSEIYVINALIRQPFANLSLKQFNASHFNQYRQERLQTVKARTVNREYNTLKHALEIASNEWNVPLKTNPLDKLSKMKENNARDRRLEPNEEKLIITEAEKCHNPCVKPIIQLALETAMRRGEILNIRHSHINMVKRTLYIPVTKNGYPRTIPLTPKAVEIIGSLRNNNDKLFSITANGLRLSWGRLISRTEIKNPPHFHDLRHEAISRFFERGLSVPEVALISGHRDYRMLARYTHMKAEVVALKLSTS